MNDSRFSINATELLRQYESGILEKLTLCHLSLKSQNTNNKTIDIYIKKITNTYHQLLVMN
jgi:hypothetical protein